MLRPALRATQPVEQFFQYSLLGLLASGFLALAGSGALDVPTLALTGAGLVLRLLLISGVVQFELSGRWIAAVTLVWIGFYPLDVLYVSREFIPATVHLICFLAVIRILSAKTNRDYFFVKVIAFLELLAATLLSASFNFFVFLTLFVIFGVATFCCSEVRRSSQQPDQVVVGGAPFKGRLAGLTAIITIGIVLMTGGLFFLLPRTARAAFRSLVSERYHLPGFSNEITLGQIGELKQQSTPVMHVRVDPPNDKLPLKWRGTALSQFDGKRWYNPPGRLARVLLVGGRTQLTPGARRHPGPRISYEVRIGPVDSDTLFFAGVPEFLNIDDLRLIFRGPGETYRTGMGSTEGRQYTAAGYRPEAGPDADGDTPALSQNEFNEHLLLPGGTDRRTIELARREGQGSTPLERARSIERYLRTSFGYTTELPQQEHADPIAYFLFDRRRGHCEYFASSMAVMLRAIHIPSRVVTGFQSGTYNRLTGWHVIRASDAHSWVEAWIPGRGWTTFDPTPPDLTRTGNAALWSHLMLYMDAVDTLWRDWVVGYSLDQQIDLISRVERRSQVLSGGLQFSDDFRLWMTRSAQSVRPWLSYSGLVLLAALALWLLGPQFWDRLTARRHASRVSRGQAVASDAAILYERMLRILRRRGLEKPNWLTPAEFARIVPRARDRVLVEQITAAYHDLRYGGNIEAGPLLVRLIGELNQSRSAGAAS
jgi:transglutaminase-like putative cysteine protease